SGKRAQHRFLALSRSFVERFGITPARCDLLYSARRPRGAPRRQSEIRRVLGVTAATISRMIRSLEELGLVVRTVPHDDRRQRVVRLTKAGATVLRHVMRKIVATGRIEERLRGAISRAKTRREALADLLAFDDWLVNVRGRLGDTSSLRYP